MECIVQSSSVARGRVCFYLYIEMKQSYKGRQIYGTIFIYFGTIYRCPVDDKSTILKRYFDHVSMLNERHDPSF